MKTNRFTYYLGTFSNTNEGNDLYNRVLKLLRPTVDEMLRTFKAEKGRFSRTRSKRAPSFVAYYHIWA
jgi:hypothetical protein